MAYKHLYQQYKSLYRFVHDSDSDLITLVQKSEYSDEKKTNLLFALNHDDLFDWELFVETIKEKSSVFSPTCNRS